MAHEFAHEMVDDQEGRAGIQITLTFFGGVLLLNAVLAEFLFDHKFYSDSLAFVAAVLLGAPLVIRAFKDLLSGHTHMDELAALGVIASFAMGEYMSAGAIAFFMIISVLIEHRTALGARKSIESLIRITPTKASRINESGGEVEVEAKDLKPGDVVRVRPGDNIPGDGVITSGAGTVNQANITGESMPVDKAVNDEVFGGTINQTGVLEIKITKAGADTTLGRVQEMILQAERTRIPIMRLIDRYATWYTPTILMLAFIVLFFTQDMNRAIAMVVIACPCAIILATPTAMVAALSAAARLGVLIKNVTDLEAARNLTSIVFDKTGTLTTGKLSVTKLTPAAGVDGGDLLKAAAEAEQSSKHPVARAVIEIADKARVHRTQPSEFEEVAGRGVRAVVEGSTILVGRETWIAEQNIAIPTDLVDESAEGLSLLFVAKDGKILGWVGLEDKTRPDAAKAMDTLREMDIRKLVMVTGDRRSVAQRVAAEMHCTDVQAEVLPAQKLELVDELKAAGHTVAVVGDGVNDAPALAAGNISIAMGAAGSDVAIHSASISLMNNNLNRIPFLVDLSRRTMSVIRQNLIFGVVYILVLMGLSAMGQIHPIVAVIFHTASSFVVIFNSARLVREGEHLDEVAGQTAHPAVHTTAVAPA